MARSNVRTWGPGWEVKAPCAAYGAALAWAAIREASARSVLWSSVIEGEALEKVAGGGQAGRIAKLMADGGGCKRGRVVRLKPIWWSQHQRVH